MIFGDILLVHAHTGMDSYERIPFQRNIRLGMIEILDGVFFLILHFANAIAGVPLEDCPMCPDLECVPMIVRTCCTMVEDNGLDIVGIYRVPGNSAAVTALTEQVNSRGEEVFLKLDDPKWHDVNVVTSLLKSFFRKLPDPIFTTDMYNVFIEMSKIEECNRRLNALRKLIRELPEVHFETLHHLCQHLVRVIDHSETNKMEVNLNDFSSTQCRKII